MWGNKSAAAAEKEEPSPGLPAHNSAHPKVFGPFKRAHFFSFPSLSFAFSSHLLRLTKLSILLLLSSSAYRRFQSALTSGHRRRSRLTDGRRPTTDTSQGKARQGNTTQHKQHAHCKATVSQSISKWTQFKKERERDKTIGLNGQVD
jgi:hypothetical protein